MTLPPEIIAQDPNWLEEASPCDNVVVTSRARFARNVQNAPFAPHASAGALAEVREQIAEALSRNGYFADFMCLELTELSGLERTFLKESRLISKEMERGGPNRAVYVNRDLKCSIMVNEEDHLRIQCLEPGLQINRTQTKLNAIDTEAAKVLPCAFHEKFGYLTACPTNVGTALRASVMMHLPGLALKREIEAALQELPSRGLTVRGFHGENSEGVGDFYQISNEVTLGRSVEQIEQELADAVSTLMERELASRSLLHQKGGWTVKDAIWRSFGILSHARKIESVEAMKLLSRVRLGIDEGFFESLTHEKLNKLVFAIQPGHLVFCHGAGEDAEERDITRANLIREVLAGGK